MSEGWMPNLLQFVPNMKIANNYLREDIFLKNIFSYRKQENKTTLSLIDNQQDQLKFDNLEARAVNLSILNRSCFISCYSVLRENFFDEKNQGKLRPEVISGLEGGNIDDFGNPVSRPFITISSTRVEKLLNELKQSVDLYYKVHNIKAFNPKKGPFSTHKVEYLNLGDYLVEGLKLEDEYNMLLPKVLLLDGSSVLSVKNLNKCQKHIVRSLTKFFYCKKPKKFEVQNEYRFLAISEKPIDENLLENNFIKINLLTNLHSCIRVHDHDDIKNLKLSDL